MGILAERREKEEAARVALSAGKREKRGNAYCGALYSGRHRRSDSLSSLPDSPPRPGPRHQVPIARARERERERETGAIERAS